MTLQHNIDKVILRDGQIFIYGWGFVPGAVVRQLSLRLEFAVGAAENIDAQYGRQRDDVQAAFANISEAQNAGFLVLAGLGGRELTRAVLEWDIADVPQVETVLELPQPQAGTVELARFGYYKMLAGKAVTLYRAAGIRALLRKVVRYFSNRPRSANDDAWAKLRQGLAGRKICVIIDHDMGGGANIYRDEVVAQRHAAGEAVLVLGFHVATLNYFGEVFDGGSSRRHTVTKLEDALALAAAADVRQIIYNCAVSFRAPLQVPELLALLRYRTGAPLLFLVHDYYAICPSHFLIDADDKFCAVPELKLCDTCLIRHRDGFVSLSGIREIMTWRDKWGAAIALADEVRVFSDSSKVMMLRAYPALDPARINLLPHKLHTQLAPQLVAAGDGLHIGVVGAVGRHKGAAVVAALAEEILRRGSNVKITVIGTLEARVPREIVQITGPYEAARLPMKIEKSGANVFLFPSIWGETFSYTSHELIAMKLPFACFDFGAQADLARRYEQGLVLNTMDAPAILDRLEEFWRSCYRLRELT
ncbi:MAG TPA: glycosyltransferase [Acidocella sp.]|nr:glycosyltransferase [Acidocella sp.]